MARSASSPFFSALPCQFSLSSTNEMPLPLRVRARIIVGWPLVARASSSASRIAFMSWPSITIACQPNARYLRAYDLHIVLVHRRTALTEPIDVGDAADRIELVERSAFGRFPDRPFSRLAVAQEHVGAVVRPDAASVERNADGGAEPLAERPGRDIDKRQTRRRVPFEVRGEFAQLELLVAREEADRRPGRVQQRRGVALRQDEPVGACVARLLRVEPHLREEQRGHNVSGRTTGRRVTAPGRRGRTHGVDAELSGDVTQDRNE